MSEAKVRSPALEGLPQHCHARPTPVHTKPQRSLLVQFSKPINSMFHQIKHTKVLSILYVILQCSHTRRLQLCAVNTVIFQDLAVSCLLKIPGHSNSVKNFNPKKENRM